MTGSHQVVGLAVLTDGRKYRFGTVFGRHACSYSLPGVYRHRKRRLKLCVIISDHGREVECFCHFRRYGKADNPTGVIEHEVYGLWGDLLCGHGKVAFVLPAGVIHHHNHLALLEVL